MEVRKGHFLTGEEAEHDVGYMGVRPPLDHAVQRVQHLSAQRGSALHLLNPDLSPIPEARASLKTMLFSDLQAGVLDTVFLVLRLWPRHPERGALDDLSDGCLADIQFSGFGDLASAAPEGG